MSNAALHGLGCMEVVEVVDVALAGFPASIDHACPHQQSLRLLACPALPVPGTVLQEVRALVVAAAAPDLAPLEAFAARAAELGREVAGAAALLQQLSATEEQVQARGPQSLAFTSILLQSRCDL